MLRRIVHRSLDTQCVDIPCSLLQPSRRSLDRHTRRTFSPKPSRSTTQSCHTEVTRPARPYRAPTPTSGASQLYQLSRATRPGPRSRLSPLPPRPALHRAISAAHRADYLSRCRRRRRLHLRRSQAAARAPGCRSCFRFPPPAALLPGRDHHAPRTASRWTYLSLRVVGSGTRMGMGMGGRTCVCAIRRICNGDCDDDNSFASLFWEIFLAWLGVAPCRSVPIPVVLRCLGECEFFCCLERRRAITVNSTLNHPPSTSASFFLPWCK
jgi:hypothetical protein